MTRPTRPGRAHRGLAAAALALAALAPAAPGQTPKAGDWFRDPYELGFELRLPRGWDFVPSEPGEPNLVGRCDAGSAQQILAPGASKSYGWNYQLWIVKFDRRPGPRLDVNGKPLRPGAPDLESWLKRSPPTGGPRGWREDPEAAGVDELDGRPASEREFTQTIGENDTEVRLYALVWALSPEVDLAVVYNGPGGKKWSKHRNAARSLARSLRTIPLEEPPVALGAGGARDRKRAELVKQVARTQGWRLLETPDYFVVTNSTDGEFVTEASERLQAIRAVYQEYFPAALAARLRSRAATERAGGGEDDPRTAVLASAPPSVVRICATREQYRSYGGPADTGGYWSSEAGELVLFDDRELLGRDATWRALNHEGFHQYLHACFGPLEAHSWFDEGHGDFFGGFEREHGRFVERPNDERLRDARELLRAGREVPLEELVRWPRSRYYGTDARGTGPAEHYAEGWSLVHFLRNGAGRAPGWDDRWGAILDTYLETLVTGGDPREAAEAAFGGLDWEAFEASWRAFTLD